MATATDARAGTAPLELTLTRVLNAPRALVWQAWTDPEHIGRWGPEGFTVEHAQQDLRPGGRWRACLRPAGGGEDLWQGGVYREVEAGRRLVYTFAWDGEDGRPGTETVVTLELEDDGPGRTRLNFRQVGFATVESRDGHRGGWSEALDALANHIEAVHRAGPGDVQ